MSLKDFRALGRMDLQGGSNNEFSPSGESISEMKLQTGMVGNPVTALSSPFFGQITGKGGRRNIELSTRITF